MWLIWDKISNINAFTAEEFLARNKYLINEKVVYIKLYNEKIIQVEGKSILAQIYGIEETLDDDVFIMMYEQKLAEEKLITNSRSFDPYANLI